MDISLYWQPLRILQYMMIKNNLNISEFKTKKIITTIYNKIREIKGI